MKNQIGKTTTPKHLDGLALWLVGVPKCVRASSVEEVEEVYRLAMENNVLAPQSYQVRIIQGKKWAVVQERYHFDQDWMIISGWVSPAITKNEIKDMIISIHALK